jgi:small multidrug resistance pump
MPTGIVYAVWSGLSLVLVTAAAWVWSKQVPDRQPFLEWL